MLRLSLIAAAACLVTGCASITDGTSQVIVFKMDPNETRCSLTRDGNELGSVTGKLNTITVHKGAKDIIVACGADGYESRTIRLTSSTQTAGVIGGAFLDLGITDMLTGAMWKYPNDVSVALDKTKSAGTPAVPAAPASAASAPKVATN